MNKQVSQQFSKLLLVATLLVPTTMNAQEHFGITIEFGSGDRKTTFLSFDALNEFQQVEFETTTLWTEGVATFSGVPLKGILAEIATDGSSIEMVALNDYSVVIPFSELEDHAPIVASKMNGKPMSVRDKGPFWVVFPYDSDPKYQTEVNYSRSIWQLGQLSVSD